jgi:hypothetical protein
VRSNGISESPNNAPIPTGIPTGVKRGRGRPKKVVQEVVQQASAPPTTEAVQDGTLPADIDPTGEDQEDISQDEGAEATAAAGSAFDLI